ncbi:MAG: hypothetical protein H7263_14880 [Candidatus Sericytochromatia bacterium]|nr:hypothetical protein [Candidatus Sericytochromatia bacterium]
MEQILEQLTVGQKRNLIKSSDLLNDLFKKTNKNLSKAKGEEIDNFINELSVEERKIILDLGLHELGTEEKNRIKKKGKKEDNSDLSVDVNNVPVGNVNELTNLNNEMVATETSKSEVPPSLTVDPETEKIEKEIPEDILKRVFKDLYPTNIHKTKYIQDNPSLKMTALTKGIFGKNAKKEDIDDFLVKQVPKNPKSMKQLGVDWLENKKALKIDNEKISSESLTQEDVREILKNVTIDELEAYTYFVQPEINENIFSFIENIKAEDKQNHINSGEFDSEKVKELEDKVKELENKLSDVEIKQKDEINNLRQNYESEKEKQRNKLEQKIETARLKAEEDKAQLVKIQGDSDRRFSDERKIYAEQIETLEKDNKKYLDRINAIGSDLVSQNKQNKDSSKSLTRIQNRIEELQIDNKELTTKNEEIRNNYESLFQEINTSKKQEVLLQAKVQDLTLKVQELEKTKIAFLLNDSEILSVIRDLNAVDETKDRIMQLLNIDTRQELEEDQEVQALDDLWVKLMDQEGDIIADYLSVGTQEIATADVLKDKIDGLLDLEQNLKAREVLVKILYEKGYKAYKSLQE